MRSGELVEDYRLGPLLGCGAVAPVYEARFEGRRVREWQSGELAIKIRGPWDSIEADPGVFGAKKLIAHTGGMPHCRPIDEARIPGFLYAEFAVLFRHPGTLLPDAFEFGLLGDTAFYVMERIRGRTLRAHLEEGGPDRHRWFRPLRAMLEDLARLQQKAPGFFHGDIKPENIVVEASSDRFRLVDPAARCGVQLDVTTEAYNPRLQILGSEADLDAIATIALELVLGRPPFADAGAGDRVNRTAVPALWAEVPPQVRQTLRDWMNGRAFERSYASMLAEWPHAEL